MELLVVGDHLWHQCQLENPVFRYYFPDAHDYSELEIAIPKKVAN